VAFLGGSDEIVIGAIELDHHVAENGGIPVRQFDRLDAFLFRSLLHLLAMLVGA
jgi:hypothetical protein